MSKQSAYEIAHEFVKTHPDAAVVTSHTLAWRLAQAVLHEPDHPDYARVCEELEQCEARLRAATELLRAWAVNFPDISDDDVGPMLLRDTKRWLDHSP